MEKKIINYFTPGSLPPAAHFFITKTLTMTQEERSYAISKAFFEIAIYCIVQNQNTYPHGLERLKHIKKILDRIDEIIDYDRLNYDHRFIKDVCQTAIIETEAFTKKIEEK